MPETPTQFEVSTHIDRAAAKDTSRYAIKGVLVTPAADSDGVWLTATDGTMMAITREAGTVDGERTAPVEVLKKGCKGAIKVSLNGNWQNNQGKYAPHDTEGVKFPPTDEVIPDDDADRITLALDAKLLLSLAQAIGSRDNKVTLSLKVNDKKIASRAIIVTNAENNPRNMGVLMPCIPNGINTDSIKAAYAQARRLAAGTPSKQPAGQTATA
jgi:hypothetical protein